MFVANQQYACSSVSLVRCMWYVLERAVDWGACVRMHRGFVCCGDIVMVLILSNLF